MNEIACDQYKNFKKSYFRNQLDGVKIQGNYIYWEKGKPDLISHPKPSHSVWTQ